MELNKHFIILLLIMGFPFYSFSSLVTSNGTGGGDWDDPNSWNPVGVPGCVDTIKILAGDQIDITDHVDYEACPPMIIIIEGILNFPDNGDKMRLPCDSKIIGLPGGQIKAPGTDNSNKISICGDWVWESSEDDLVGPFVLGGDPLPIELLNFTAEIDNTAVKLIWITASEINNDFFTIERSTNGLDFEEIAQIPGEGNSAVERLYEYIDENPIIGTSYYRLKQTDYNGEYEYLKLIAVNYSNENEICTLKVYPNPCYGACTVKLEDCPLSNDKVNVELYDAFGKKIVNTITPKSTDADISFYLNASNNLSPGVYFVKSSTNGKNQSEKVIINK